MGNDEQPNAGPPLNHTRHDGHLEDRLRGLILHQSVATDRQFPPLPSNAPPQQKQPQAIPAMSNPAEQRQHRPQDDSPNSIPPVPPHSDFPKVNRKRPNQAQRRQMNNQLVLPVTSARHDDPTYSSQPHFSPVSQQNLSSPYRQHSIGQAMHFENMTTTHANPNSNNGVLHRDSRYHHPPHQTYGAAPVPYFHNHVSTTPLAPHSQRPSRPFNFAPTSHPGTIPPPSARRFQDPSASLRDRTYELPEMISRQSMSLTDLCNVIVANAEIARDDIRRKEAFRLRIEQICSQVIKKHEQINNGSSDFPISSVQLKCFGSLSSGFATKTSDMDLGLLSPFSQLQPDAPGSPIPRLLERAFLDDGIGARLLSRTRVPIIKLCERPPKKLMTDLLQEREKWERGGDTVNRNEAKEEDHASRETTTPLDPGEHATNTNQETEQQSHKSFTSEVDIPNALAGPSTRPEQSQLSTTSSTAPPEPDTPTPKQGENQSLLAYYGVYKKSLRKLGIRDLTLSNARDFTANESHTLGRVCLSFIRGLYHPELRSRVSVGSTRNPGQPNPRSLTPPCSLYCAFLLAEGEWLAMLWDSRTIGESTEYLELRSKSTVSAWEQLRRTIPWSQDGVHYIKDLQVAVDKLRKIPSIQLLLLRQNQCESATHYSARVTKLVSILRPTSHYNPPWSQEIISCYISGIYDDKIRELVRAFADVSKTVGLADIFRRHISLQLARDFERALSAGVYNETTAELVAEYIRILRQPMKQVGSPGGACQFVIPIQSESSTLLEQVARLQDPSTITTNQFRDPYHDRLEFPQSGAGVQCDINFSAHLALHNSVLLRCYAHTDPRVRPMVLFVKHWAKVRGINTPYRGTLSSYGFVLMVLHYLVNICHPFVCPNLQKLAPPISQVEISQDGMDFCKGRDVRFWRNEDEITRLAQANQLNQNTDSIGHLLRAFFEYYAHNGLMSTVPCRGFDWGREVISIRTQGGILTKQEKGWTGAKTVFVIDQIQTAPPSDSGSGPLNSFTTMPSNTAQPASTTSPTTAESPASPSKSMQSANKMEDIREVRNRYLFAIEDPFETDHNVARTVTHNGIVSIRDEFRRAWRIIQGIGHNQPQESLLEAVDDKSSEIEGDVSQILRDIHGDTVAIQSGIPL